jgi:hypothetical protein
VNRDSASVASSPVALLRRSGAALEGLDIFLRDDRSPLYKHGLVAQIVTEYVERLATFSTAGDTTSIMRQILSHFARRERFSGVPERAGTGKRPRTAKTRLGGNADPDTLRAEMADFILRHKAFPKDCSARWPSGSIWSRCRKAMSFAAGAAGNGEGLGQSEDDAALLPGPLGCVRRRVEPAAGLYVMVEDSREDLVKLLVTKDGKLDPSVDIPLPVGGLLNPKLAREFDAFVERNSAYSLSPSTIATNMDRFRDAASQAIAPHRARAVLFGRDHRAQPAGQPHPRKVANPANAWLLTWTIQDVYSKAEKPAKQGLVVVGAGARGIPYRDRRSGSGAHGRLGLREARADPARGLSGALCGGRDGERVRGYQTHIISGGQVISDV